MSEPLRFKPVNPAHEMIYSTDGGWVSWEDYARLKAEVERLTAFTTRTIIPNEELQAENARLKAEVERLRFIGDEIIMDVYRSECLTDKWCKMARKWDAAKEGKPHA
jgi:hypothetical protein